jgi:hypothetical protein
MLDNVADKILINLKASYHNEEEIVEELQLI